MKAMFYGTTFATLLLTGFSCAAQCPDSAAFFAMHCSSQIKTLSLDKEGRAVFSDDWSHIGNCRVGRGSSLRAINNTMEFALLVKTDHTGGTDYFHMIMKTNTSSQSAVLDGPGMGNDEPFETWSGKISLPGANAGTSTEVCLAACC
jgi:hypothetical protein